MSPASDTAFDTVFLVAHQTRGLLFALVLFLAMGVVLALFAGGYWYFVVRNHQADEPTDDYAENE